MMLMANGDSIEATSLAVLTSHWDEERQYTYPNLGKYPHQWLWDSCFASICWTALGNHERAVRELESALSSQFPDGFVPHIRYSRPNKLRGPLSHVSSYTQPPVYSHAVKLAARNAAVPSDLVLRVSLALRWLWGKRRTADGLMFIVHPWESGADDSPRWDSWFTNGDIRRLRWNRADWTSFDRKLLRATTFDSNGEALSSSEFVCAPAGFNAIACHAAQEFADLTADDGWGKRSRELADLIDDMLWDSGEGLWQDAAVTGGGESSRIPTLDGVLGALTTRDKKKATRALDQLLDPNRFAAPYGLAYVARKHWAYSPDDYWRGSAWMQMNYLTSLAARRWERQELIESIRRMSREGASRSQFAEYWNPETGKGHGAIPLTWSALVTAL